LVVFGVKSANGSCSYVIGKISRCSVEEADRNTAEHRQSDRGIATGGEVRVLAGSGIGTEMYRKF
jgi:hypothetical protein